MGDRAVKAGNWGRQAVAGEFLVAAGSGVRTRALQCAGIIRMARALCNEQPFESSGKP